MWKKILEKDVWLEGGMGEKIDESWVISPLAYQNTISPNLRDYRNENKEQTPGCFWTKLPQQLQQRSSSHFAFGLFILFYFIFISVSVGSQIVAHTLTEAENGPNRPNTIDLWESVG